MDGYDVDKLSVLLVEDTPIIQKANTSLLESLNCIVTIAKTGREAVKKCEDYYDIVLMDLDLPDIDGITACRIIRKQRHNQQIPIIIALTASGKARERECRKVGMSDYAIKPLMIDDLCGLLEKWQPNCKATIG